MLGYDGTIAGNLEFARIRERDAEHVVLTGDYRSWTGRWEPSQLPAGQALVEPTPLFPKLDSDKVVADELRRMEAALHELHDEDDQEMPAA
jgi:methionyl-tRNA synthetase